MRKKDSWCQILMMSGGIYPKKQSIENTKTILKSQTYKNLVRNNDFSTNTGLESRKYLSTCLSQSLFRTALKWIVELYWYIFQLCGYQVALNMPTVKYTLENCLEGRCFLLVGPSNTVFNFFASGRACIKFAVEGTVLRTFRAHRLGSVEREVRAV